MVDFERVSTMLVTVNDYYHFDYGFVAAYFGYVVVAVAVAAVMVNVGIAAVVVVVAAAVKYDDYGVVVVENDVE